MIAVLIFVFSFLTLLQFFVSYSRSVIAASRNHELSEQTCQICGSTARTVSAAQFQRLLQLIALCPRSRGDDFEVWAVVAYFRLLGLARVLFGWAISADARWIESERGGCAYVAAVTLERRIVHNRMLVTKQTLR